MNVQLLIDEIVRQTTVLIAQLSTSAGLRAPLSHVADQVFLELARELDSQGVRRKVVADMFGMALRTYQMKVRRLNENADRGAGTLWQQLYADLSAGSATRDELERRHRPHTAKQIAAAVQDMVQSGVAYSSGRGQQAIFGLTSDADRQHLSATEKRRVQQELCWYLIASGAAANQQELQDQLRMTEADVDDVLQELQAEGQVSRDGSRLTARAFEVTVGAERGWETSVFDHFRAVTTAIAAKVNSPTSAHDDEIGGGTRSFLVHPEHPHAQEVYALLADVRKRTREVWQRVATYNEQHAPPERADRVTFYFGQNVVRGSDEASGASEASGPSEEGDEA